MSPEPKRDAFIEVAAESAYRRRRGYRLERFPKCWEVVTGEDVSELTWYVNRDRQPYPRAVIERNGIEVVAVTLEPPEAVRAERRERTLDTRRSREANGREAKAKEAEAAKQGPLSRCLDCPAVIRGHKKQRCAPCAYERKLRLQAISTRERRKRMRATAPEPPARTDAYRPKGPPSPDEVAEWAGWLAEGWSMGKIALMTGNSPMRVSKGLKAAGVDTRQRNRAKPQE